MLRRRKRIAVTVASLVAGLVLVAGFIWVVTHPYSSIDLSNAGQPSSPSTSQPSSGSSTKDSTESPATTTPTQPNPPAPDPSTIKNLTITQWGVVLGYDRTLPGMSYLIKRTGAGTQYVSLMYDGLIGDKCTGDQGEFASIIKDPTNADSTALINTVKLGSDTYGLALPDNACTGDVALFTQFQNSMKTNFPYMTVATP